MGEERAEYRTGSSRTDDLLSRHLEELSKQPQRIDFYRPLEIIPPQFRLTDEDMERIRRIVREEVHRVIFGDPVDEDDLPVRQGREQGNDDNTTDTNETHICAQ